MKILAPYAYFTPEQAASIYLWQNLHEDFAKNNIDCVIYTPTPTRGVSEEVRQKSPRKEILYDGRLAIHRFPLYREGRNPISRALRYFLCTIIHFFKCMYGEDCRNCDVIFTASTPPIKIVMACFVKRFRNIPIIYSLQDIFPDSLSSTGMAQKGSLLWKIGRILEDYTYKHVDKIIVISDGFKQNIMAKGVPEERISVIRNWVDENAVVSIPREHNKIIRKYNLDPGKFYVTYNGNLGHTQNIDMLLDVIDDFQSFTRIHFVIVGEGACRYQIEEFINSKHPKNLTLLPFQPYEDISHVFSLGDVSIVISKDNVGNNSVPSKTWSIMSASRPVLASFDGNELKQIIEGNQCGIYTKAGDAISFKNAVLKLFSDPNLCNFYGRNGRRFVVENLSRHVGTAKYIEVIKSVVKDKKGY